MFERRHYEWLASWAGDNIEPKAAKSLATALATDNPDFQPDRFIVAYGRRRLAHLAASRPASPRPLRFIPGLPLGPLDDTDDTNN